MGPFHGAVGDAFPQTAVVEISTLFRSVRPIADVAAPYLENIFQITKGGGCAAQRNAWIEVMDDVELHTHGNQVAEAAFEGARVTVASLLIAGVVGSPGQIVG